MLRRSGLCILLTLALSCMALGLGAKRVSGAGQPSLGAAAISEDSKVAEAAPGLPLPDNGLVWILDSASGKPKLSRLYVNSGEGNLHRAKNFLRGSFFLDAVSTVEVPMPAAKVRSIGHTPIIFFRLTTDEQEEKASLAAGNANVVQTHLVLLHVHPIGDVRVLFGFTAHQIAGAVKLKEDVVDTSTEEIAGSAWRKITPTQPLPDGEYAVALMPDSVKDANSEVYDFGIGQRPSP